MKSFKKLKHYQREVKIPMSVSSLGFFASDCSFGNEVKEYQDWLLKEYEIKLIVDEFLN